MKHGVLCNEGLLTIDKNNWQMIPMVRVNSLVNLMQTGLDYGLSHLWVHADTGIDLEAPLEVHKGCFQSNDFEGWNLLGHTNGKHVKSVYGWPLPKGNAINLIFPHYSGWGQTGRADTPGWGKVATPKQLLVTIHYLEQMLGIPLSASPGSTGWNLMKKMHPEWVANFPRVNLENMHFREGARDMVYQRAYNPSEGKRLYKVDKNSAYLHSCTLDAFYGVGNPELDNDGTRYTDKTAYKDGHRPGVWYCNVTPGNRVLPNYEKAGKRWLAGPLIRLMRKVGYEVEVINGWYFPEAHQVMEKWALFLWNAREFFTNTKDAKFRRADCREFARQACKQIAVCTVGLASYHGFDENEETDKHRPDIKSQTVARTYELMHWNITKFHQQTERVPLLVYMDALYYVASDPSFLEPILARQGMLGGYKYEGFVEITPQVEEILNASTNVSKKLELLNKIGWTK